MGEIGKDYGAHRERAKKHAINAYLTEVSMIFKINQPDAQTHVQASFFASKAQALKALKAAQQQGIAHGFSAEMLERGCWAVTANGAALEVLSK